MLAPYVKIESKHGSILFLASRVQAGVLLRKFTFSSPLYSLPLDLRLEDLELPTILRPLARSRTPSAQNFIVSPFSI